RPPRASSAGPTAGRAAAASAAAPSAAAPASAAARGAASSSAPASAATAATAASATTAATAASPTSAARAVDADALLLLAAERRDSERCALTGSRERVDLNRLHAAGGIDRYAHGDDRRRRDLQRPLPVELDRRLARAVPLGRR